MAGGAGIAQRGDGDAVHQRNRRGPRIFVADLHHEHKEQVISSVPLLAEVVVILLQTFLRW